MVQFLVFLIRFGPLEYIPNIPPLLSYVIISVQNSIDRYSIQFVGYKNMTFFNFQNILFLQTLKMHKKLIIF